MPPPRSRVPSYRLHKPTGQAVVTVRDSAGGRRDVYLGAYNSETSRTEYARLIAAGPEKYATPTPPPPANTTVAEVLVHFLKYAADYYSGPDGRHTSEFTTYKLTARAVRTHYAALPAAEFSPRCLAAVRDGWVDAGLTRREVNRRVRQVRRIFRWGSAEELVPHATAAALAAVFTLAKGRTPAPDRDPIKPVAETDVRATLPHVRPEVAGMIEVQLYTGMGPGEVCKLRPADIDRSGDVWIFQPAAHKGAWRGKDRVVAIGPKAQAVLAKFWPADPSDFVFSPNRAVVALRAERAAARSTPRYPSHMANNAARRKPTATRPPAAAYTTCSYARAVTRGVKKGNTDRQAKAVVDPQHGPNLPRIVHWHPNQLRHPHRTTVRKRFGLEAAQVALGHARADVTQVYAEKNLGLAAAVALELG